MAYENKLLYLKTIGLVFFALIAQVYFVPLIELGHIRPDFIVLAVIFIGYKFGVSTGAISGFVLGLLLDALSASPLGISSLANSITGFLAGQVRDVKISSTTAILTTILLILFQGTIFIIFYQFKTEATFLQLTFSRVFPNTLYTFLIGHIFVFFFRSTFEVFDK